MGCLNVECKFDFISNLGPDILRILMLWYAVNVTDFACKLFIFGGFYTMRGWLLGQNIWSRYLELIMVHDIKLQKTFTYNFKCVAYCAGFELWYGDSIRKMEGWPPPWHMWRCQKQWSKLLIAIVKKKRG